MRASAPGANTATRLIDALFRTELTSPAAKLG